MRSRCGGRAGPGAGQENEAENALLLTEVERL